MNKDEFLPEDARQAIEGYRVAWTCISRIEEMLMEDNLKEVKLSTVNLLSSLNDLEKLKDKKVKRDRLGELVHCLVRKGISIEMIPLKKG